MPIVMVGPERDHHATPPGATLLRVDEPADHGAVIVDHMAEIGTEMAGHHVEQPVDPIHRNAQRRPDEAPPVSGNHVAGAHLIGLTGTALQARSAEPTSELQSLMRLSYA